MPAKAVKCGNCDHPIGKGLGSVQCRICESWWHPKCANVPAEHLDMFKDKQTSITFACPPCLKTTMSGNTLRDDVRELKDTLNDFIKNSQADRESYKNSLTAILNSFKDEVSTCMNQMKADITNCSKLINNVDSSTTAKINALEMENNILHRRLNRNDIIISGMPAGLDDLMSNVISLCSFFDVCITDRDICQVFYMNGKKRVLVKFINVAIRDKVMRNYFKTRSLKLSDVMGGDVDSRIYLNDHYCPAASNLSAICRKLIRQKTILKYKVLNTDRIRAKLTLHDGKEVVYNLVECAALLDGHSSVI